MSLITDKERKSYEQAIAAVPPIEALLNRVLVIQIREEDEVVEDLKIPGFEMGNMTKVGSIIMPTSTKEKMKNENETVKAVVKSVGPNIDGRKPEVSINELVMVFPSVFETKFTFDGIDYFSYSERDLVARERKASAAEMHPMD